MARPFAASGAAGLTTTAQDLAAFAAAVMEADEPAGRGVLRPSTIDSMWARPAAVTNPEWPHTGSALGYFVRAHPDGATEYGHGGSNTGWQATFSVLPERRVALVVVTNSSNGWAFFLPTNELMCAWYAWAGVEASAHCPARSVAIAAASPRRAGRRQPVLRGTLRRPGFYDACGISRAPPSGRRRNRLDRRSLPDTRLHRDDRAARPHRELRSRTRPREPERAAV